jgi:outer membrane protein
VADATCNCEIRLAARCPSKWGIPPRECLVANSLIGRAAVLLALVSLQLTPVPSRAQTRPGQTRPGQTRPGQTRPGQTRPASKQTHSDDSLGKAVLHRIAQRIEQDESPNEARITVQLPHDMEPWWQVMAANSLTGRGRGEPVSVEHLLATALQSSPHVRVIADSYLATEVGAPRHHAEFQWRMFSDYEYADRSEPVGNLLTTGGAERFNEEELQGSIGLRRKNRMGGKFEVSQELGKRTNNSIFLAPVLQGTSRVSATYTQPILRGAGRRVNMGRYALALIDTAKAEGQMQEELEQLLVRVNRVYWELYRQRVVLIQQRNVEREVSQIERTLNARSQIEAARSQQLQTRAALTRVRASIRRLESSVAENETILRSLLSPGALPANAETITMTPPWLYPVQVNVVQAKQNALFNHPTVTKQLRNIEQASVRMHMTRNEILPAIDVIFSTHAQGLEANYDVADAFLNQFSVGEPTYSIGFRVDVPLHRNAQQAIYRQRRVELRRSVAELHARVQEVLAEIETASRNVSMNYGQMAAHYDTILAENQQVQFLQERWRLSIDDGEAPVLLDRLFESILQRADAEQEFISSATAYNQALFDLKQAEGTLLYENNVQLGHGTEEGLPVLMLDAFVPHPVGSPPRPEVHSARRLPPLTR